MSTQQRKISRRIQRNIEKGRIYEDELKPRGAKILEAIEKKRQLRADRRKEKRSGGKNES